jgi:hypothetical protein
VPQIASFAHLPVDVVVLELVVVVEIVSGGISITGTTVVFVVVDVVDVVVF